MLAYNVLITKKEGWSVNLSTVALILLAWQLLSNTPNKENTRPRPQVGLSDFLSDDTKSMINCVDKLSSSQCSQEDRTSAIFQMISNPAVINLASNLFGGMGNSTTANPTNNTTENAENLSQKQENHSSDQHVNSEGYRFETPSSASQEFFRPIDNIADTEIKHKLYWFYDNWYVK